MRNLPVFCCVAVLAGIIVADSSSAATWTTFGTFEEASISKSAFGNPLPLGPPIPERIADSAKRVEINGLSKFDPAWGTLNHVTLAVELSLEKEFELSLGSVLDTNLPHSLSYGVASLSGIIGYRFLIERGPASHYADYIMLQGSLPSAKGCTGAPFSEACSLHDIETTSITETRDLSELDVFRWEDFLGHGEVEVIGALASISGLHHIVTNNAANPLVETTATLQNMSIALVYDYTPVSEPISAALAILCAMASVPLTWCQRLSSIRHA